MSVFFGILRLGLIPLVRGVGVRAELSVRKLVNGVWSAADRTVQEKLDPRRAGMGSR